MGVAFDGDGDRAIFVDADGQIVDGDAVLLMCARQMQAGGRLSGDAIVATVMSNIGLEIALRDSRIDMVRCAVGDKYVMEEMLSRGLSLGGEQSGHVIWAQHSSTGDGILTGLQIAAAVSATAEPLSKLAGLYSPFPQVLINVEVGARDALDDAEGLWSEVQAAERTLGADGRVLL